MHIALHVRRVKYLIRRRTLDQGGASLVEYALLVALIAIVCFAAVAFFGSSVSKSFSTTGSQVSATPGG